VLQYVSRKRIGSRWNILEHATRTILWALKYIFFFFFLVIIGTRLKYIKTGSVTGSQKA
jgi:hypothetical protein